MSENDWRRTKHIETLDDLLVAMTPDHWSMGTELNYNGKVYKKAVLYVSQDCNYYVDTKQYKVDEAVARQIIDKRFVSGRPEWGYTSDWKWNINDEGRAAARVVKQRREDEKKVYTPIEDHDPGDEG